jgi:N4-(beta-N-acetylglucosaminyl)-L-asparaginase
MENRRSFIKKAALAAGAIGSGIACTPQSQEDKASIQASTPIPTVIATWDNRGATQAGMDALLKGGSALDAVEAGARVPEGDPDDMSVGYGGHPDRKGIVTLDACIMDHLGNAGSVTFLQGIKHPISVARKVMEETKHVMLSGQGALEFALSQGFQQENLLTDKAKAAWEKWKVKQEKQVVNENNHDTIGILALDKEGLLCGACTTSGAAYKLHGRVGDSPILGAGMFVDGEVGGACATGQGELVMTTLGSFLIVELMRNGATPQQACEEAIDRIVKKYKNWIAEDQLQVGYLGLNLNGDYGYYSIRKGYSVAVAQKDENVNLKSDFALDI